MGYSKEVHDMEIESKKMWKEAVAIDTSGARKVIGNVDLTNYKGMFPSVNLETGEVVVTDETHASMVERGKIKEARKRLIAKISKMKENERIAHINFLLR